MEQEKKIIHLNGIRFEYSKPKEGGDVQKIAGYACKWNETNANGWNIAPTAFDESLAAFHEQGLKPRLDPYHIGIVESINPDGSFYTIEGNTNLHGPEVNPNGGAVARKRRQNSGVLFLVGHLPGH